MPMISNAEAIFVYFPISFKIKGQSAGQTNAFDSPNKATKKIESGNNGIFNPILFSQPKRDAKIEVLAVPDKIAPNENSIPVMAENRRALD